MVLLSVFAAIAITLILAKAYLGPFQNPIARVGVHTWPQLTSKPSRHAVQMPQAVTSILVFELNCLGRFFDVG